MSVPLLELEDASLGYSSLAVVIERVELGVTSGDFLVIGGPNGGGKTTLLKTLAGLLRPLRGKLTVDRATRLGYVPQQAIADQALPLTAFEMVEFGAAAARPWWKSHWRQKSDFLRSCLADCHAEDFARKSFSQLSGGQRQRVLLARALATQPNCVLLDEPTAGVDRLTQGALAELLSRLHRERGLAVVLVTHEWQPFEAHATRFLWVQEGRVNLLDAAAFRARQAALGPGVPEPMGMEASR